MKTGIKVGDLMTRGFIHTSPDMNLKDCARMMVKKRVGSLVITVGDNKLAGILTEKDILWAIVKKSNANLSRILAKDLMKRKVITIKPSADIIEALDKIKKKKVRRLPVIENGKVIGLITTKDILRVDPGLFELIAETNKIKEETEKLHKRGRKIETKQGVCEECGEYGVLLNDDGAWVCESCYNSK